MDPNTESITKKVRASLLKKVSSFYCDDRALWKKPITTVLNDLKNTGASAVLFGGSLRSLVFRHGNSSRIPRPRDIDIVFSGVSLEDIQHHFQDIYVRNTRFGGLKLSQDGWEYDVWPLEKTWAFTHDAHNNPSFADLPYTTFLNLEAIAVEIWPTRGRARRVFAGDGRFFDGVANNILDINRKDNPFPELCVVRSLIIAAEYNLAISPQLAEYIISHGLSIKNREIEDIQRKHYGWMRVDGKTFSGWVKSVERRMALRIDDDGIQPFPHQLELLPRESDSVVNVNIHAI